MLTKILFIAGTAPFMFLGLLHTIMALQDVRKPRHFAPTDDAVRKGMEASSPRLTNRTTMWRAWLGFNISHGMGATFFGFILCVLALTDFSFVLNSGIIMPSAIVFSAIFLWLAKRFWFSKPLIGIAIGLTFFTAAYILKLAS